MANWNKFVNDYANYFSSNQSKGPFDAGKKLSQFYLDAIGTAKAIPSGNNLNGATAKIFKPILDIGFGLGFYLLLKQKKTYEDIKADPRYYDAEENFTGTEPPQGDDPPGVDKIADAFAKLKQSDLSNIRSKNVPTFKIKEKDDPKSNKIFDYKTPFSLEVEPENVKLGILGRSYEEILNTVDSIGDMPMLKKIISDIIDPPAGAEIVSNLGNSVSNRASSVGGIVNLTLSDLRSAAQNAVYSVPAATVSIPYLAYLRTAIAAIRYDASSDVADALKQDGGKILEQYGEELGKFVDVATPYIAKNILDEEEKENAAVDEAIAQGKTGAEAASAAASTLGKGTGAGPNTSSASPQNAGNQQDTSPVDNSGNQSQTSNFTVPETIGINVDGGVGGLRIPPK